MYHDPYDEDVQVKFHRTDPTGRTVPLETDDYEEFTGDVLRCASLIATVVLGIIAWWLW